jgi:hypothetical protein
VWNPTHHHLM